MTGFLIALTIFAAAMTLYSYGGYYVLLRVLCSIAKPKNYSLGFADNGWPFVSIYICCYNEQDIIYQRLENLVQTTFPSHRMQIIVYSDGSTDGTAAEVERFRAESGVDVKFIECSENKGQPYIQKMMPTWADGEILVKSDAETRFSQNTLVELIAPFADPAVGVTGGRINYYSAGDSIGEGYRSYRAVEDRTRECETYLGYGCKVDGPCMAYRKILSPDHIHAFEDVDHIMPIVARQAGYLTYNAGTAEAVDVSNSRVKQEFRQRSRMTRKTLRSTFHRLKLIDFVKHPAFTLCLLSHRIARAFTPFYLITLLAGMVFILAQWGLVGSISLILLAAVFFGAILALLSVGPVKRLFGLAWAFLLANAGFFWGVMGAFRRNVRGFYLPTRQAK